MILVDSSFFIALVDRRDQWHAAAKSLLPLLAGETILISDLIVAESVTIIGRRSGGKTGEQLYHYFMDNCDLVVTDEKILNGGMQVFLRFDGTLSVSDAVSVFIMKKRNIDRICSFDSDFDKVEGIVRVHKP
ncbi:MAG: PIN domain-containing protein [Methanoregula sp.]|uniref:type II toxin-antitoxin system VapC family toxin n=1 Tax=Methanoregula sp. TaxID=2052170 RepID=UPI0025F6A838|nr:PIN domain-containing protein [Methanoregula sp.]MCK9631811.1 PIN domain-containing protein [Methanoregula sp.]